MTRAVGRCAAILAVARAAAVLAQAPDFSGTWKLDLERSRVTPPAALAGLVASGAPPALHITQPANGTVIVESQINESHVRMYVPGVTRTTPVTVGPPGSVTTTSRWERRALISEGRRETSSGTSAVVTVLTERFMLSEDGQTLVIEVTAAVDGTTHASTMVYTRTRDVGPCESWPTPCKPFS